MGNLSKIDFCIIAAYLVFCLIIGLRNARKVKNINDFAVGECNFPTLVIVSTLFATYVSGGNLIGDVLYT